MQGHQAMLAAGGNGGKDWWIETIDGKTRNATSAFAAGHPMGIGDIHKGRIEIRKGRLAAWCDGEKLFAWEGRPEQLGTHLAWSKVITEKDRLYMGSNGAYTYHKLTLIPKGVDAVVPATSLTSNAPAKSAPVVPSAVPEPVVPALDAQVPDILGVPGAESVLNNYLSTRKTQVSGLAKNYGRALEVRLGQAAKADDLKLATAFEEEKERLTALVKGLAIKPDNVVAAIGNGAGLGDLPESAPAGLVGLRKTWTSERQKIKTTLDNRLQKSLNSFGTKLMKARDLENARKVIAYREFLITDGSASAVVVTTPVKPTPVPAAPGNTVKSASMPPASVTKAKPFENSLGMRFVSVPITGGPSDGKPVLFSIWETRVQDFEAFLKKESTRDMPTPDQQEEGDHPVINVSMEDALSFIDWLNEKERKTGKIGKDDGYRLPTDHEWSCAIGIGSQEDGELPPRQKGRKIKDIYPWGTEWPPTAESGNYRGYGDKYQRTSPVGSFEANELGLYDIGGNAWERCSDTLPDPSKRVLRGAAWDNGDKGRILSSERLIIENSNGRTQFGTFGFRVVLERGAGK
jgi:hypothetical protein